MKVILVIDIADDVAEAYEDFTVDYDLRGTPKDDQKVNESIKYVEDADVRPLPNKWYEDGSTSFAMGIARGFNKCLDEIMGETE